MAEDNNKTAYSPFDINRDGVIDTNDATLFHRYLSELRGDALVKDLVPDEEGVRSTEEIEQYLDEVTNKEKNPILFDLFDLVGNGQLDALSDGLLFRRYTEGVRDSSLTEGVKTDGSNFSYDERIQLNNRLNKIYMGLTVNDDFEVKGDEVLGFQLTGFTNDGAPQFSFNNGTSLGRWAPIHYQGYSRPLTPEELIDGYLSIMADTYESDREYELWIDPRWEEGLVVEGFEDEARITPTGKGRLDAESWLSRNTQATVDYYGAPTPTKVDINLGIDPETLEYITLSDVFELRMPNNPDQAIKVAGMKYPAWRPDTPLPAEWVVGVDSIPSVEEMAKGYYSLALLFGKDYAQKQFASIPEEWKSTWEEVPKNALNPSNVTDQLKKSFTASDIQEYGSLKDIPADQLLSWADKVEPAYGAMHQIATAAKKYQEDPDSLTVDDLARLYTLDSVEEYFYDLPEKQNLFGEGTSLEELSTQDKFQAVQEAWRNTGDYESAYSDDLWKYTTESWRFGMEYSSGSTNNSYFSDGKLYWMGGIPHDAEYMMPRHEWSFNKKMSEWGKALLELDMPLYVEADSEALTAALGETITLPIGEGAEALWYDSTRLYMKGGTQYDLSNLPVDSHNQVYGADWVFNHLYYFDGEMPDYSEFANPGKKNEGRGFLIDITGGDAPIGSYSMVWVEQPRRVGTAERVLDMPALNILASLNPISALVLFGLKALNELFGDGRTLKGSDYAGAVIAGLKITGKLSMPKGAAEAEEAGKAAEAAKLAELAEAGITGEVALQIAEAYGAQVAATTAAGVGIFGLSARQTVTLINAVGSGESVGTALMNGFGKDYLSSGFDYLGIDTSAVPDAVMDSVSQIVVDVANGDSFEDALNKEAASVVGKKAGDIVSDFFEENNISDEFNNFFGEAINDLKAAASQVGEVLDDTAIKPIVDLIEGVLPEGGLDSLLDTSEGMKAAFDKLEEDIRVIGRNIDDSVIEPISDAAKGAMSKFVGMATVFAGELPADTIKRINEMVEGTANLMGIGLEEMPGDLRNILEESFGTLVLTGELTDENKARIISRELVVAERVTEAFKDSNLVNTITPELFTVALRSGLNAAMQGGDVESAFLDTIADSVVTHLKNSVSLGINEVAQTVSDANERSTTAYKDAKNAAAERDRLDKEIDAEIAKINEIQQQQEARQQDIEQKRIAANAPDASDAEKQDYYDAIDADSVQTTLDTLVLEDINSNVVDLAGQHEAQDLIYETATGKLSTEIELRDAALTPFFGNVLDASILDLNGYWRGAEEYAVANGIPVEDAHEHYLSVGIFEGVPVSDAQYKNLIYNHVSDQTDFTLQQSGIDVSKLSAGQRAAVFNSILAEAEAQGEAAGSATTLEFLQVAQDPNSDINFNFDPATLVSTALSPPDTPLLTIPQINYTLAEQGYTNIVSDVLDLFEGDPAKRETITNALATNQLRLVTLPDGSKKWVQPTTLVQYQGVDGGSQLTVSERPAGLTLQETAMYDPTAYLQVLGVLPPEEARVAENNVREANGLEPIPEGETSWVYRTIKGILDHESEAGVKKQAQRAYDNVKLSGGSDEDAQAAYDEEYANASGEEAATLSVAIRGVTEVVGAFNSLAMGVSTSAQIGNARRDAVQAKNAMLLAGASEEEAQAAYDSVYQEGLNNIDFAMENELSKNLDAIQGMAMGYMSQEHQDTFKDMMKNIDEAEGFMGTTKAIFGEFVDHPTTFLIEFVGVEVVSELIPLVIGGGTFAAVKAGSKLAIKDITEEAANTMASKAALRSGLATDMMEAAGGGVMETYEDAYATAETYGKDTLGLSGAELEAYAGEYASGLSMKVGLTAAMMVGILSDGSQALEGTIFKGALKEATDVLAERGTKNLSDDLVGAVAENGLVIVKESIAEAAEAAASTYVKESSLATMDPNRDFGNEMASNVVLSAIASAGTTAPILGINGVINQAGGPSGSGPAGGFTTNAESNNPLVHLAISQNPELQEAINNKDIEAVNRISNELGMADFNAGNDLLNAADDSNYISSTEAIESYARMGIQNPSKDALDFAINLPSTTDDFNEADFDQQLADAYQLANPDDIQDTYSDRPTPQHHYDIIQRMYAIAEQGGQASVFDYNEDGSLTNEDVEAYKKGLNIFERNALEEYEYKVNTQEIEHTPNQTGILDTFVGDSLVNASEAEAIKQDIASLQQDGLTASQAITALNEKYEGLAGAEGLIATEVANAFTADENISTLTESIVTKLKEDGTFVDVDNAEDVAALLTAFIDSEDFKNALPSTDGFITADDTSDFQTVSDVSTLITESLINFTTSEALTELIPDISGLQDEDAVKTLITDSLTDYVKSSDLELPDAVTSEDVNTAITTQLVDYVKTIDLPEAGLDQDAVEQVFSDFLKTEEFITALPEIPEAGLDEDGVQDVVDTSLETFLESDAFKDALPDAGLSVGEVNEAFGNFVRGELFQSMVGVDSSEVATIISGALGDFLVSDDFLNAVGPTEEEITGAIGVSLTNFLEDTRLVDKIKENSLDQTEASTLITNSLADFLDSEDFNAAIGDFQTADDVAGIVSDSLKDYVTAEDFQTELDALPDFTQFQTADDVDFAISEAVNSFLDSTELANAITSASMDEVETQTLIRGSLQDFLVSDDFAAAIGGSGAIGNINESLDGLKQDLEQLGVSVQGQIDIIENVFGNEEIYYQTSRNDLKDHIRNNGPMKIPDHLVGTYPWREIDKDGNGYLNLITDDNYERLPGIFSAVTDHPHEIDTYNAFLWQAQYQQDAEYAKNFPRGFVLNTDENGNILDLDKQNSASRVVRKEGKGALYDIQRLQENNRTQDRDIKGLKNRVGDLEEQVADNAAEFTQRLDDQALAIGSPANNYSPTSSYYRPASGLYAEIADVYKQVGEDRQDALDNLFKKYEEIPGFNTAVNGVMKDQVDEFKTIIGRPATYYEDRVYDPVTQTYNDVPDLTRIKRQPTGLYLEIQNAITLPEGEKGQAFVEIDRKFTNLVNDLETKILGDDEITGALQDAIAEAWGPAAPEQGRDNYFKQEYIDQMINGDLPVDPTYDYDGDGVITDADKTTFLGTLSFDEVAAAETYRTWKETATGINSELEELRFTTGLQTYTTDNKIQEYGDRLTVIEEDIDARLSDERLEQIATDALGMRAFGWRGVQDPEYLRALMEARSYEDFVELRGIDPRIDRIVEKYKYDKWMGSLFHEVAMIWDDEYRALVSVDPESSGYITEEDIELLQSYADSEEPMGSLNTGVYAIAEELGLISPDGETLKVPELEAFMNSIQGVIGSPIKLPYEERVGLDRVSKDLEALASLSEASSFKLGGLEEGKAGRNNFLRNLPEEFREDTKWLDLFLQTGRYPRDFVPRFDYNGDGVFNMDDYRARESDIEDGVDVDIQPATGLFALIDEKTDYTDEDAQKVVNDALGSLGGELVRDENGDPVRDPITNDYVREPATGMYKFILDEVAASDELNLERLTDSLANYSTTVETNAMVDEKIKEAIGRPPEQVLNEVGVAQFDPVTNEPIMDSGTGVYAIAQSFGFATQQEVQDFVDAAITNFGDKDDRTGIYAEIDEKIKEGIEGIDVGIDEEAVGNIVDARLGNNAVVLDDNGQFVKDEAGYIQFEGQNTGIYDYIWQTALFSYEAGSEYAQSLVTNAKNVLGAVDNQILETIGDPGGKEQYEKIDITHQGYSVPTFYSQLIVDENGDPVLTQPTGLYALIANMGLNDAQKQEIIDAAVAAMGDPEARTGIYAELDAKDTLNNLQVKQIVEGVVGKPPEPITEVDDDGNTTPVLDDEGNPTFTDSTGIYQYIDQQLASGVAPVDLSATLEGYATIEQLDEVKTDVDNIEANVEQLQTDMDAFEASQAAQDIVVGDVKTDVGDLQTDVGDLQTDVGDLQTDMDAFEASQAAQDITIQQMADILGVPVNEVTEEDKQALSTIIAESEVILENRDDRAEIAMYDVNNDGVLDTLDQQYMEAAINTGDYSGFVDSVFTPEPTGLIGDIEQERERNEDLQTQIDAQNARIEQEEEEERIRRLVAKGRTATTTSGKPGDLAMIQYQYDIGGDNIFATPQQSKFYSGFTPYGNKAGGKIKAKTDEILKIIGKR